MSKTKRIRTLLIFAVILLGAGIFLMPYIYMVFAATQDNETILGGGINFFFGSNLKENWAALSKQFDYGRVIFNSVFVAFVSTALATFSSTLAGYALAKYRFKGNQLIFRSVMLARMVPGFTTLIPLFYIMSRMGLTNTYAGIIIPSVAATTSVFMMRQYSKQFPTELMESARIDGASEWKIFTAIALPILKPTIITNAMLIFMASWNNYLFPLVMLSDKSKFTVPLVIKNMSGSTMEQMSYGALMLVLATSVIPIVLIYIWVQSKFKENDIGSAIK